MNKSLDNESDIGQNMLDESNTKISTIKDVSQLISNQEYQDVNHHNWTSKVARFLAYIVDGGILQSLFTLTSMVQMLKNVKDGKDERLIQAEIAYLLHIRRVGYQF